MLSAIGGGALEVAGFELVYATAPGDGVRVGLADAWALRLESVPPVRRFASLVPPTASSKPTKPWRSRAKSTTRPCWPAP